MLPLIISESRGVDQSGIRRDCKKSARHLSNFFPRARLEFYEQSGGLPWQFTDGPGIPGIFSTARSDALSINSIIAAPASLSAPMAPHAASISL
jgi:hypothetical protein